MDLIHYGRHYPIQSDCLDDKDILIEDIDYHLLTEIVNTHEESEYSIDEIKNFVNA